MPTPRVLLTVATYNERENLPPLVDELFGQAPQAELLVVDDNSPDGTGDWAQQRSESDPRVKLLRRSGKLGLGTAIIAAMQYAIEHGYDYLLNLDADFSHPPKNVPQLLEAMEGGSGVDVMIGSRYVPGGGADGWPWRRRMMSRCVNLYARAMLGLGVRDVSGAFRCYRVSRLAQLDFDDFRSTGYSFQEEVLWRLKRAGASFGELPIRFVDRRWGASKINYREALDAVAIILRLGIKNWTGI